MFFKMLLTSLMLTAVTIAQTGLTGITWELTKLKGAAIGKGVYTIQFKGNGEAGGKVDCNGCGWEYSTSGATISIKPGICTMMACDNPTRDYEYQTALSSATTYKVNGTSLYLMKNSDTVAVFVDAARLPNVPIGGVWNLDKLNRSAVNIAGYTLSFTSDSTCGAKMQCNTCSYRFAATLETVSFKMLMCTLVMCQGTTREGEFATAMGKVTRWKLSGSKLLFLNASDTLLEYSMPVLSGKVWELQSIWQAPGRLTITTPDRYTATFATNGTISVKSDCNMCSGNYTQNAAAGTLSISALLCTRMMCGTGSKDALFNTTLSNVERYSVNGNMLYCYAATDTLVFKEKSTATMQGMAPAGNPKVLQSRMFVDNTGSIVMHSLNGHFTQVHIVNVNGRCVKKIEQPGRFALKIDAKALPTGMYMIKASTTNGTLITGKINLTR